MSVARWHLVRESGHAGGRAAIEAAWGALTCSTARRDPAAAAAALPAAVRLGLLQTAGLVAGIADESGAAGDGVTTLVSALRDRDRPGDDVRIDQLTAVTSGGAPGRVGLQVDLEMFGGVMCDQRGGYLELATGHVWPIELVEDGQVEGLEPFKELPAPVARRRR